MFVTQSDARSVEHQFLGLFTGDHFGSVININDRSGFAIVNFTHGKMAGQGEALQRNTKAIGDFHIQHCERDGDAFAVIDHLV